MNDEFLEGMAEIFEVDTIDVSQLFDEANITWDSLAIVSTIALIDQCFDVMVPGSALSEVTSVQDILDLIKAHS